MDLIGSFILTFFNSDESWIGSLVMTIAVTLKTILTINNVVTATFKVLIYLCFYNWIVKILKKIRKKIPFFSVPYNALDRLDALCERVASSLNEEKGTHPQYSSSFFNFSFGKAGKSKSTPIATVRELEQELMSIINDINGEDCPRGYQAQFIIVFDELDKIANVHKKGTLEPTDDEDDTSPTYEASVKGFTEAMPYEQRKQNVLRLLANMKLFITSVKAKCVFISGYELFDASLADLSDREFAISSIFNGVLNVTSFLSPEREESDVSSMTELYLATMLLPESVLKDNLHVPGPDDTIHRLLKHYRNRIKDWFSRVVPLWPESLSDSYLKQKITNNILQNGILKDELPSLRWYNQYLIEIHILNNKDTLSADEIKEREQEIQHVMLFLKNFCVYLSHISNGSPKKIATYFEKYVRVNYDTIKQFDWYDVIEVGLPTEEEVRKQCVLYFDVESQKLINFIHYIAAPVMNAITNEVSHYGDKLLVSSSFILDQIYKYHGKGFSWRNLEQMPELLNTNKNPELRDSLASIMEFLLQTHITTISSSIFQYKFHKQISEEISMLSKTSEEAAAIFNFTLNEAETVKRYNNRLLWNYMALTNQTKDKDQKERYYSVLERLHENQGDIYFSEEDYYRAIHEYRSALQYIDDKDLSAKNLIPYLKCSLKVGMSYEYRHTFENAYMVYCQIINKLIHLRWVDEKEFGLEYTMRLTHDWRVKQVVLVDAPALSGWYSHYRNTELRKHCKPGLIEDMKENLFHPKYSIDSDKTVSSLTKNYTPEKSDYLLKLTPFEDVKFIYQAILAKLFVIEKMESSGITKSSIDAAEAEFITLYSKVNHNEKYILAADFFSKLASILYYKNTTTTVTTDIRKEANKELYDESIYTTLYLYDIDIFAFLDDFCYHNQDYNAIDIKDCIIYCIKNIKTKDIIKRETTDRTFENLKKRIKFCNLKNKVKENNQGNAFSNETKDSIKIVKEYLDYLDKLPRLKFFNIQHRSRKLIGCYERRKKLLEKGCNIPCTACKYVNRSMTILMSNLFGYTETDESKVITLLRHTSHKELPNLRPEILSQLAYSSEQLADIMMSCGYTNVVEDKEKYKVDMKKTYKVDMETDNLSQSTIDLLIKLAKQSVVKEGEREDAIKDYQKNNNIKGNIDRAILYYWVAYRYYDIASMHHEAVHCIWRITCVIENYLTVLKDIKLRYDIENLSEFFDIKKDNHEPNNIDKLTLLLQLLFTQAVRIVSRQHDNYDSVEIHEHKWLFHKEFIDDVDLTELTIFPSLQSIFMTIVNIKLLILQLIPEYTIKLWKYNDPDDSKLDDETYVVWTYRGKKPYYYKKQKEQSEDWRQKTELNKFDYLSKMYEWIIRIRHERTFKSNIELNHLKVKLNELILNNIFYKFEESFVKQQFLYKGEKENIKNFYPEFFNIVNMVLFDKNDPYKWKFFQENNEKDPQKNNEKDLQFKLDCLDFLIYDSIECLCSIINVLPPHNQYSTFSSSFVAEIYEQLWIWSKYYQGMYTMYLFYRYYLSGNKKGEEKIILKFPQDKKEDSLKKMENYAKRMSEENVVCKDDFGYRYSKLFMSIRHNIDDATIHHVFVNYSAEMAIRNLRAARGINSEGQEYKNMINNMHILDDDLRNDTCQSNLADERYLINSGIIYKTRVDLQNMYVNSSSTRLRFFESLPSDYNENPNSEHEPYSELHERYSDSEYNNTEY